MGVGNISRGGLATYVISLDLSVSLSGFNIHINWMSFEVSAVMTVP